MNLILWRHAEAEDGFPDMARVLTKRGLKDAALMAKWLRPHLPAGTRIITSPAERTRQTAQALSTEVDIVPALAPGNSEQALLAAAGWPSAGSDRTVVVVGHQPTLGETAALLIGDTTAPWSVKKGAVWWITSRLRGGAVQAALRMVMSPEQLR